MKMPHNNAVELFKNTTPQRKGIRDNTESWLARQIEKAKQNPMVTIDANADTEFEAKIKPTMLEGEKIMEWISRVGCSRAQAMAFTPDELRKFVEQQTKNAADERFEEFKQPQPAKIPKFLVV
jgi:uncharacterized protein (DUF2344 family)